MNFVLVDVLEYLTRFEIFLAKLNPQKGLEREKKKELKRSSQDQVE